MNTLDYTQVTCSYLEDKKSKVKVTRPINAHTVNAQYLQNGKAYDVQAWYRPTDGVWRPVSPTRVTTYKVKGQGRKFMWFVWQALVDKSRNKHHRNTKFCRKAVHPTGYELHQFECQRSRSSGRLKLRPEVRHIFRMETLTSILVYTDGVRRPISPRSAVIIKVKGQGRDVTWCVWQVLAHKSRTKSPRNTTFGR